MSLDLPVSPVTRTAEQTAHEAEWAAGPLRPVARWILDPDGSGRDRMRCVWEVPEVVPLR